MKWFNHIKIILTIKVVKISKIEHLTKNFQKSWNLNCTLFRFTLYPDDHKACPSSSGDHNRKASKKLQLDGLWDSFGHQDQRANAYRKSA